MRHTTVCIACLLWGWSIAGAFASAQLPPVNQTAVEGMQPAAMDPGRLTWDFGSVKAGQLYKHDFLFKNESTLPLKIKDVSTSCGCTVSEVKKKSLQPGEETVIAVTFNSKDYKGDVQQFIYVATDDMQNPIIRYTIKANVLP